MHTRILAVVLAVAAWAGLNEAFAANTIDMLTDMEFTGSAAGTVEVQPILISDNGTVGLTAASDLRLIIPATYGMVWDSADSTAEILMSGTGVVNATVSSFPNADKTCTLNVTTGFAVGDRCVITGLGFKTWSSTETGASLGLAVDGTDVATSTSTAIMCTSENATGTKMSSANNFSFALAQVKPALPDITITDSSVTPVITAGSNIRIVIPNSSTYGTAPIWDISTTTVTITGGYSANVSTAVTYANANRTVILDVTTSFLASSTITVSGLKFATSGFTYNADCLQLVINGTDAPASTDIIAVDDRAFAVGPPNVKMTSVNTVSASAAGETIGAVTIQDSFGAITAASDIRLLIMSTSSTAGGSTGRDNLTWTTNISTTISQPTAGVVTAGAVSTADHRVSGGSTFSPRLLFLAVTTSFAPDDEAVINALKVDNATATATKLYLGLIVESYGATVSAAFGRVTGMATEQSLASSAASAATKGSSSGSGGSCFLGSAGRTASH